MCILTLMFLAWACQNCIHSLRHCLIPPSQAQPKAEPRSPPPAWLSAFRAECLDTERTLRELGMGPGPVLSRYQLGLLQHCLRGRRSPADHPRWGVYEAKVLDRCRELDELERMQSRSRR